MSAHFTERPCAVKGLTSYRYRGRYGWIMIGAKDDADALNEANRSLSGCGAVKGNLQVWEGERYQPVQVAA